MTVYEAQCGWAGLSSISLNMGWVPWFTCFMLRDNGCGDTSASPTSLKDRHEVRLAASGGAVQTERFLENSNLKWS